MFKRLQIIFLQTILLYYTEYIKHLEACTVLFKKKKKKTQSDRPFLALTEKQAQ